MVLSSDPDAIVAPSGLQDIVEMPAKCPSNVWMSFPLRVFQTLTAPSAPRYISYTPIAGSFWRMNIPPLAIMVESGENFTADTPRRCPLSKNFC